jgi:hypothetical protein
VTKQDVLTAATAATRSILKLLLEGMEASVRNASRCTPQTPKHYKSSGFVHSS